MKKAIAAFLGRLFGTKPKHDFASQLRVLQDSMRDKRHLLRTADIDRMRDSATAMQALAQDLTAVGKDVMAKLNDDLALANHRITAICNTMSDGVLTLDTHGRVQSINKAMLLMFGLNSESAILGRDIAVLLRSSQYSRILKQETQNFTKFLTRTKQTDRDLAYLEYIESGRSLFVGKVHELQIDTKTRIGTTVELTSNLANPKSEQDAWLFIVICRNVTERTERERLLSAESALRIALLESVPLPVFYTDSNYRIQWCNPYFIALFSDLSGQTVYRAFDPQLVAFFTEDDVATESYRTTLDLKGKTRTLVFNRSSILDRAASDQASGIVVAVSDITELESTRERQKELSLSFEGLLDVLPDIVILSKGSKVLHMNDAARSFLSNCEDQYRDRMFDLDRRLTEDVPMLRESLEVKSDFGTQTHDVVKVKLDKDHVLTFARDVSFVHETARQYQAIATALDCVNKPVFVCDSEFALVYASRAFCSASGQQHVLQRKLWDVIGCDEECIRAWSQHGPEEVLGVSCDCLGLKCARVLKTSDNGAYYVGFFD